MPKAVNRGAVLKDFLAFWEKSLEGPLFAVTVAVKHRGAEALAPQCCRLM
jgi:uncharacterized protein Usg